MKPIVNNNFLNQKFLFLPSYACLTLPLVLSCCLCCSYCLFLCLFLYLLGSLLVFQKPWDFSNFKFAFSLTRNETMKIRHIQEGIEVRTSGLRYALNSGLISHKKKCQKIFKLAWNKNIPFQKLSRKKLLSLIFWNLERRREWTVKHNAQLLNIFISYSNPEW